MYKHINKIDDVIKNGVPDFFKRNNDIDKTAYLNCRFCRFFYNIEENFAEMGNTYFEVADYLLKECISDNTDKKADVWILPIIFNIIHGIELYLKCIISYCRAILNKEKKKISEGGHNIQKLLTMIEEYNEELNDQDLGQIVNVIKQFMTFIYSNTNDMSFARYPVDAKYEQSHFYAKKTENSKNIVIDLPLLLELLSCISCVLANEYMKLQDCFEIHD